MLPKPLAHLKVATQSNIDVSPLYQFTLLLGFAANESYSVDLGLDDDTSSKNSRLKGMSQGLATAKP